MTARGLPAVVFLCVLSSCGYVGDPLPPALGIPATITDFRAWESGPNIEMLFTLPDMSTEGLALKSVQSVELRVAQKTYPIPTTAPGPVSFHIPAGEWIGQTVTLSVRATGPRGKASVWSNPSVLGVIQPLPKPGKPALDNVAQGVALSWAGVGPHYRIFRAEADEQPIQLARTDTPAYVDATTSYGTRYRYLVQAIAEDNQWSEVSDPTEITPIDKFPPAIPTGLTVLAGAQSIELSWSRNTESDFRGYNVFRSVDGGQPTKINDSPLEAPAFSDTKVEAGKKYKYTIAAVDASGNESAPSIAEEASL